MTTTSSGVRRIGLTLALGGLLVVVDTTVTVVALPAVVTGLDASLAAAQWVTTGYLLGIVAVIPLSGWAAARFGARRVYLTALLVFTVFSACAGLAGDVASLAVFRFLQGLGGGLLNPVGQAIGLRAAPREQRGRLMSLLVLPLVIGPVCGPPLAGRLIEAASWRWIFLVNIPLGLLAFAVCARVLPRTGAGAAPSVGAGGGAAPTVSTCGGAMPTVSTGGGAVPTVDTGAGAVRPVDTEAGTAPSMDTGAGAAPPVDWRGLGQLSGGAVLLVHGGTLLDRPGGPSWPAALLIVTGPALMASFVRRARRVPAPLVDLGLLRRPAVRAALGVLASFAAAYFGSMGVLPLYVQGVNGDPASLFGLLALPQAVAVGLVAR